MDQKKIPVIELFGPTIQGEGALAGQVSYFLRTGGCSFRCSWCDSMHAVEPAEIKKRAQHLTPQQIIERVRVVAPGICKSPWITFTGGDPVLWDLGVIAHELKFLGFRVAVETQAHLWHDWLEVADLVTASPKPPSSGMAEKFSPAMLQKYVARLGVKLVLKFVVFSYEDLDWATRMRKLAPRARFFLSSGTVIREDDEEFKLVVLRQYHWLAAEVLRRPELVDATVLPQLHALLWGRQLGH
jgi:7-carboxy-7-deazaguanine synthase